MRKDGPCACRQKAFLLALAVGTACTLSGCRPVGDGAGARVMGRYVSREYGKAKLIQEEHDGNRAAYTYEDEQYGFTYQASARRFRAWFDGPLPGIIPSVIPILRNSITPA